jgi:hypothetical protein
VQGIYLRGGWKTEGAGRKTYFLFFNARNGGFVIKVED